MPALDEVVDGGVGVILRGRVVGDFRFGSNSSSKDIGIDRNCYGGCVDCNPVPIQQLLPTPPFGRLLSKWSQFAGLECARPSGELSRSFVPSCFSFSRAPISRSGTEVLLADVWKEILAIPTGELALNLCGLRLVSPSLARSCAGRVGMTHVVCGNGRSQYRKSIAADGWADLCCSR